MRRFRLNLGRKTFFVAAFVAALVVLLPLRLVLGALGLDERGLAAREATGSLWAGRLVEARVGGAALGDLDAGLRPLSLLIGRARLDLAGEGEGAARGSVTVSRNLLGLDDASGRIPLADTGMPLQAVVLDEVSVRFRDGLCEAAEGIVRVETAGDMGGMALPPTLTGPARCGGGGVLLSLTGAGGEGLGLQLLPDRAYRAELTTRAADPAARERLLAAGFAEGPNGLSLTLEGRY